MNKNASTQKRISRIEYKTLLNCLALLLPFVHNMQYGPKEIVKPIIYACVEKISLSAACKKLRKDGKNVPNENDILHHLFTKLSIQDVYARMDSMLKKT